MKDKLLQWGGPALMVGGLLWVVTYAVDSLGNHRFCLPYDGLEGGWFAKAVLQPVNGFSEVTALQIHYWANWLIWAS